MPDDEFASRLSLQSDERVLWSGRPDPKAPTLSPIDWIAIPFSLLWAGLTTSIFFFALRNHSPNLPRTVLAGIGVVVGTYLVAGRFLYKRWLRRRTRYFITTKRLITVRSVGRGMVEEAYIHDVGQIHR